MFVETNDIKGVIINLDSLALNEFQVIRVQMELMLDLILDVDNYFA